ncbi:MAG: PepSY domain-containing protein [Paracoccaceae bacterium]
MKRFHILTAALLLAGTASFAAVDPNAVANQYADAGYSRVEVKVGPTQIKVEAIKGDAKVEVVYDKETGEILKSESERVRAGEDTRPGISVRDRSGDFVDGSDDDDDDHHSRGSDDDDDDDDDRGRDRDDDDDDDRTMIATTTRTMIATTRTMTATMTRTMIAATMTTTTESGAI